MKNIQDRITKALDRRLCESGEARNIYLGRKEVIELDNFHFQTFDNYILNGRRQFMDLPIFVVNADNHLEVI